MLESAVEHLKNVDSGIDSVVVQGVRVLGKQQDQVTQSEVKSIVCDFSTEAHLIRHFTSLPTSYTSEAKGKEFMRYDIRVSKHVSAQLDDETLTQLLSTQGSKFHSNLEAFLTPKKVFEQAITCCLAALVDGINTYWIAKADRDIAYFLLHASEPIGTQNVVKFENISKELQETVFTRPRGGGGDAIDINFIKMNPPETNVMVIMLQRTDTGCKLETAYPGMIVTDLPQPAIHSEVELELCKQAWSRMAFVSSES